MCRERDLTDAPAHTSHYMQRLRDWIPKSAMTSVASPLPPSTSLTCPSPCAVQRPERDPLSVISTRIDTDHGVLSK